MTTATFTAAPTGGSLAAIVTVNVRTLMPTRGFDKAKELAQALGWNETKMSRAFSGHRWDLNDLPLLARTLRVTVEQLITPPDYYLPGTTAEPTMAYSTPTLRSRMSDLSLVTSMSRPLSFAPKLGQEPFRRAETTL